MCSSHLVDASVTYKVERSYYKLNFYLKTLINAVRPYMPTKTQGFNINQKYKMKAYQYNINYLDLESLDSFIERFFKDIISPLESGKDVYISLTLIYENSV
jgi:hypothetical protein